MLIFDTDKGLLVEDTETIRLEVQNAFKAAFGDSLDVCASSPQGQIIDSITAMIVDRDNQMLELTNQLDPSKNEGIYQEAIGHLYFLERKSASKTIVKCICYGLRGTSIPKSSIVKSVDNYLFYSVDDAIIGENGEVEIYFECEEYGSIPINAEDINSIVSVISGFDSVINLESGITGSEEETRAEFEQRRALSVAKNSQGSVSALTGEIAAIDNIIDYLILENAYNTSIVQNGVEIDPHSLYICVLGGSNTDIAKAIYTKKDMGCGTSYNNVNNIEITHVDESSNAQYSYNITRPYVLDFYIKVQISLQDYASFDLENRIKSALIDNFYGINQDSYNALRIGEKVLASRFYFSLLSQGINELVSLKISTDNINFYDEIQINAEQFPQLLDTNIIIEVQNEE